MTAFEFLLALASVLIGLAISNLVMGAHKLLRARARVRWGWLTPLAGAMMFLKLVSNWWGLWALREDAASVAYGAFLGEIVDVALLSLLSSTALPDEVPEEGCDLPAFYQSNRILFWGLFSAYQGLGIVVRVMADAADGIGDPARLFVAFLPNLLVLALGLSMLAVRWKPWHALGLAGLCALYVAINVGGRLGV